MYVCIYVYIYIHTYIHWYAYALIYIYIHTPIGHSYLFTYFTRIVHFISSHLIPSIYLPIYLYIYSPPLPSLPLPRSPSACIFVVYLLFFV